MKPARRLLMFDFDGVIVDSLDYFYDSFMSTCLELGFNRIRTREDFSALFDSNMYEGMVAAGIPESSIQRLLAEMSRRLNVDKKEYEFFPGMADALIRLCQCYPVYVITSNTRANVERYLARHSRLRVDGVLGSEADRSKTRKIRRLIERHADAFPYYIGDTTGDVHEARAAGAKTVAATWGWHERTRLERANPDHLAASPSELLDLFECRPQPREP